MEVDVFAYRQVRADYDEHTIVVYQAFRAEIADAALTAGTFVEPFSRGRMTWVKPSFLWMMYRCGWASKPGQERVLAIRMDRVGFEAALSCAALSSFTPALHASREEWQASVKRCEARVQWDPERDIAGHPLAWRSLQLGLSGSLVDRYVDEWIVDLADITALLPPRRTGAAPLPVERPYPLPDDLAMRIGVTVP